MAFTAPDPAPAKPLQALKDEGEENGPAKGKGSVENDRKKEENPKKEATTAKGSSKGTVEH